LIVDEAFADAQPQNAMVALAGSKELPNLIEDTRRRPALRAPCPNLNPTGGQQL
jgi:hypothetical protein